MVGKAIKSPLGWEKTNNFVIKITLYYDTDKQKLP